MSYGRIAALHDVSLEVRAGEIVVLLGSNGAGKTTLLRSISGLLPLLNGTISFEQRPIERLSPSERVRLGVAQVAEGRQIFAPLAVSDNLRLGAFARGKSSIQANLDQIYAMFPALSAKRDDLAGGLSGGQQQMLAIGRALMANPKLLLLDEPSMGLSPLLVRSIFEVIRQLRERGTTVLLVEQNAVSALKIADRGYVLASGSIVLADEAKNLLNNAQVQSAYLGR